MKPWQRKPFKTDADAERLQVNSVVPSGEKVFSLEQMSSEPPSCEYTT